MMNDLDLSADAFLDVLSTLPLHVHAHSFSEQTEAKIKWSLDHAWMDSTLKKYRGVVKDFHAFCNKEHVPSRNRLPANEHLLCAFAASRVGSLAGDMVQSHMAALKAWHVYNNTNWLGGTRLRYIINGVSNLAPQSSKPPRPPVTRSMLSTLALHLDLSNPLDTCCLAAACFALWGQVRLGEILSPWEKLFKPLSIACRHHLSHPFNANGSRKCHLPFTGVAKSKGEDIVVCRQNDSSDPIRAVNNHLSVNEVPPNLPLFSFRSEKGWRCLTRKRFLSRCNSIWLFHNIPTTTSHSFRIGSTTEFLLAGVPPDVVKALGRWSSDAFLRYWRSLDRLAPLHIESLPAPPSSGGRGALPSSRSRGVASTFGPVSSPSVHSAPPIGLPSSRSRASRLRT